MSRWFLIWTGHTLAVLAGVTFLASGYFGWRAAKGTTADEMWWPFVICVVLFLLSLLIAAAAAYTWNSPLEREYIREYDNQIEHAIAVGRSGAPEITDPMPGPARVRRPVSGAYAPEKNSFQGGMSGS